MKNIIINKDVNYTVLDKTGLDMMQSIYCEELAELIQVISKIKRYGLTETNKANLAEEIADVCICLQQMKKAYGVSDDEINNMIKYKQERAKSKNFVLANIKS